MTLDGLNVLLVEDDTLILHDLKLSLARKGADVTTATSLHTGLAAAQSDFDVAILDVRLHDTDVLPIAKTLHEKQVPLIFHSAVAEREDVISAFPNAKSLSKPVREVTLLEAVLESVKGN